MRTLPLVVLMTLAPTLVVAQAPSDRQSVRVLGEVRSPGVVPLNGPTSLLTALARAGAPTSEGGTGIDIWQLDGQHVVINLNNQEAARLHILSPGDIVVVPRTDRFVTVVGAVRFPHRQPIDGSTTLLTALARAGAPTSEAAPGVEVLHLDGRREVVADLDAARTYVLRDGDVVIISRR